MHVVVTCAADLHDLRRRVLRGGDPHASVTDERDDDATSLHLGVVAGDRLVAAGSFYVTTEPDGAPTAGDCQLRYLATDVDVQGHGAGSLLLRAAQSRLSSRGVTTLWANARESALGFYRQQGWAVVAGSEFLSVETGLPHVVITKTLRRDAPVVTEVATTRDAAALAALREEMYFSITLREFGSDWINESVGYFESELAARSMVAVVARAGEDVVASAVASLRRVAPTPRFPRGHSAYVHTVSTRPEFRRRGISRELVATLLEELRQREVERVELHATDQGEHLYHDLGFTVRSGSPEMRLGLRESVPE